MLCVTKWFANCLLSTLLILLTACTERAADPGRIEFSIISTSSKSIEGSLSNGSGRPLKLRVVSGAATIEEVWPDDVAIECKVGPESIWTEEPFAISHGKEQPKVIELASQSRMRLQIPNSMPTQFKGGTCRVRIKLLDDSVVDSLEFHPSAGGP